MSVNFCRTCNGNGTVGWFWKRRVCPTCKASTEKYHPDRPGGYMQPPPDCIPTPPPPPPPKRYS